MSNATLTSLAMLKVSIDQKKDYLEYLKPFVLQVLIDRNPSRVTDKFVAKCILEQYGLEIPNRTIQLVLQRVSRAYALKKSHGVYRITGSLPNPQLSIKLHDAERHINAVISGLIEFSQTSAKVLTTTDNAMNAICAFLSKFDIQCLSAYLRNTTIPSMEDSHETDIVLVSDYVISLQQSNPERFESFVCMVTGHMLANALLCPDLLNAPATYKGVTFYFDTPLLVQIIGIEGEAKRTAVKELVCLLLDLGGEVAAFSHSRDELERVVKVAATKIDASDGRGNIIMEARRQGTTESDLLLLAAKIDELLIHEKVKVKATPQYNEKFQIDETAFEQDLDVELSYFNERAKEYDINSVRSIYELRQGIFPFSIERSQAILVTSNVSFARAAWKYGQKHEMSREVSSVITDFSLANVAWLKAPMGAPQLPMIEVLAFSYAALRPSSKLLNKFLKEIDKLEEMGNISSRDHQILRSDYRVNNELMELTLGDEAALTEETITKTLERVSSEIKKEVSKELDFEKKEHKNTLDDLKMLREENFQVQKKLYWRCYRKTKVLAWGLTSVICLFLIGGVIAGMGIQSTLPVLGPILTVASAVFVLWALVNLIFGSTVKLLHQGVQKRCLTWLIKRESVATGIDMTNLDGYG